MIYLITEADISKYWDCCPLKAYLNALSILKINIKCIF